MGAECDTPTAEPGEVPAFDQVTLEARPITFPMTAELAADCATPPVNLAAEITTDAPVKPDGERAAPTRPKLPSGPTAEELAEYDAETARLVNEQAGRVAALDAAHEGAAAEKTAAKKALEAGRKELMALISRRQAERGKPPERDLFTGVRDAAWRSLPLDTIKMSDAVWSRLDGVATLGELADQIGPRHDDGAGVPFGLRLNDLADLRAALQEVIDREAAPAAEFSVPGDGRVVAIDPELWRSYPIQNWTRFGCTDKDVQKMAAGEVKRETGRRPIRTVGDLADFSTPTASGYSRQYADIKGIGPGGADRISEAETRFWAWWRAGGEMEFAREMGVPFDAPKPGDGSGSIAAGDSLDGADGDPAGLPLDTRGADAALDGAELYENEIDGPRDSEEIP
jgi:hypothetical protein